MPRSSVLGCVGLQVNALGTGRMGNCLSASLKRLGCSLGLAAGQFNGFGTKFCVSRGRGRQAERMQAPESLLWLAERKGAVTNVIFVISDYVPVL